MPLLMNKGGRMKSNNYIEYVFKDDKKRDLVLIFPGGGYERTSPREAMPVAKRLIDRGFNAAIFWYRETRLLYPEINDEGLSVMKRLKDHPQVKDLHLLGFSAGAHYALMLSELGHEMISKTILAYPVVSSDQKIRHEGSIKNLLGSLDSIHLDDVSLEKHIHHKMKPVFIMHTADDQAVPVENSLNLIEALKTKDIPFECHIYQKGRHGLSLGTKDVSFEDMDPDEFAKENKDVSGWFELAIRFLKRG